MKLGQAKALVKVFNSGKQSLYGDYLRTRIGARLWLAQTSGSWYLITRVMVNDAAKTAQDYTLSPISKMYRVKDTLHIRHIEFDSFNHTEMELEITIHLQPDDADDDAVSAMTSIYG